MVVKEFEYEYNLKILLLLIKLYSYLNEIIA